MYTTPETIYPETSLDRSRSRWKYWEHILNWTLVLFCLRVWLGLWSLWWHLRVPRSLSHRLNPLVECCCRLHSHLWVWAFLEPLEEVLSKMASEYFIILTCRLWRVPPQTQFFRMRGVSTWDRIKPVICYSYFSLLNVRYLRMYLDKLEPTDDPCVLPKQEAALN